MSGAPEKKSGLGERVHRIEDPWLVMDHEDGLLSEGERQVEEIQSTIEQLRPLCGTWRGQGRGHYPTIDAFQYRETLTFELDSGYPMLHYVQKTWLLPDDKSSHWECGFIRAVEGGAVEFSNAQDSGRVEVLRGRLSEPASAGETLRLVLASVALAHDDRLQHTGRTLVVAGDRLSYAVEMATHTTPRPLLQSHLEAELHRVQRA